MLDFPGGCGIFVFMFRRFSLLLLLMALFGCGITKATTFLTLQSTYLGDGWFQYQMNVMNDPFFTEADITDLQIIFTNQIDQTDGTAGWSYQGTNEWEFTNGYPARPYSETFLIRSSETSWRLATNVFDGALVLFSLFPTDFNPMAVESGVISGNIVGNGWLPCLVPCDTADADGSPTNFLYVLKLLPDVTINQLIQTNGNIYGVDFTWDSDSTFLIQGSTNLNNWTNIGYIWSYPPETVWTTNTPLNNYGQFFRVELVADGHATNLPPLTSALAFPSKTKASVSSTTPRVTGSQFVNGKFLVKVATQSGQMVLVQAMNSHGTIYQSRQVTAKATSVTATFDVGNLPNPVFFNAVAVQ
jgi:hypothetical protein